MTDTLASAERLISILLLFSEEKSEWTSNQLLEATGYSRTSLYRYLKTLKETGLIVSLPQRGYVLGPRLTELDYLMQRSDPLILHGQPLLQQLADRYPCSAFLARWYEKKILCVASQVSAPHPRSSYPRGQPMPLGRGAISRVIMAHLPKRQRREMIAEYLPVFQQIGLGKQAIHIEELFRQIRRDGYVIAYGEVTPGVVGISAAVLVGPMMPVAALCVTLDEKEPATRDKLAIAAEVRAAAERISRVLQEQSSPVSQSADMPYRQLARAY